MEVFNKFYSSVSQSVSSTVSQLSGVLPGNPVTREYEVLDQVASAGIGLLWKVYNGYKKSTRQEVSVFVFEKKQLERWPKDDREMMFDILKRGVQQLTKIRHPHILTVQHPLEESRESLAFATEPVFSSLANILSEKMNNNGILGVNTNPYGIPSSSSSSASNENKLYDVEIKHGILQLAEGLTFLHADMKLIHRNLCPESVLINKNGNWKIFGFDFCISSQTSPDGKLFWPHQEYNSTWHAMTQPYLEYSAPEIALNSVNTPDSDLFSLGVLIYAIYSGGKPIKLFGKDYGAFRRFANELNQGKYPNLSNIPVGLSDFLKCLLHPSPERRPRLHELSKISFFEDVGVKTLNYLDSLYQWDNLQKSKFYKGLPQIIPTLPHRVNMQSVLPCLIKEFVNSPMIPFVLPNVLLIAENCTKKEYIEQVLPHLKPIMKLQEPIQILLIFMKKMDLMLKLTPADEVKMHVLPMLYRALDCDVPQMQELCLSILPTFSSLIDYSAMKNSLLPRIKKLCLNSSNVSVKVNCLICVGKLLESLDKWLVLDEILPFLSQIQSREPAVLMAITGIYKLAMTSSKLGITKEVMATKIIPFLMPLCIENGLTVNQFNSMISLVKDMVNRIEVEHRTKIEQLSTIQKDTGHIDPAEALTKELSIPANPTNSVNPSSTPASVDDLFANVKITPPPGYIPKEPERKISSTAKKPDIIPKLIDSNLNTMSQAIAIDSGSSTFITSNNPLQSLNQMNNNFMTTPTASGLPVNSTNSFITTSTTTATVNNQNGMNFWSSRPAITANTNTVPSLSTSTANFNNINNNNSNNCSSFDSLDPLKGIRNIQKMSMNQMATNFTSSNSVNPANLNNNPSLLHPRTGSNPGESNNNNNINTLSQQDILDFLN